MKLTRKLKVTKLIKSKKMYDTPKDGDLDIYPNSWDGNCCSVCYHLGTEECLGDKYNCKYNGSKGKNVLQEEYMLTIE